MIYVVSKYVISFAGAQTSLLAKYPKRQGARKTNAFTDYSKQCCAAIQATCRRQQTPQLWREWWWKGTDYFFLLNMPHLMTVSLNVLSDVRLCCKSKTLNALTFSDPGQFTYKRIWANYNSKENKVNTL